MLSFRAGRSRSATRVVLGVLALAISSASALRATYTMAGLVK